jgi:hypothetical protein
VGPDGWAEGWTGCGRWAGGPASSLLFRFACPGSEQFGVAIGVPVRVCFSQKKKKSIAKKEEEEISYVFVRPLQVQIK